MVVFRAAKAVFTVLITPASFGTTIMIVPTAFIILPTIIRAEPTAATTIPMMTMNLFVPSLSPENQAVSLEIVSASDMRSDASTDRIAGKIGR